MSDNVSNLEVARIAAQSEPHVYFGGLRAWVSDEGCVTAVRLGDYQWDERQVSEDEARRAILVGVYEWVKEHDPDWLASWVRGKVQVQP